MTLSEAIEYCEDIARSCELGENPVVGSDEHWQIAQWLEELKQYKEKDLNSPLTWDELRYMEGKPVWVEDNIDEPEDLTKCWAIYRRIEKAQETEYALLSDFYYDKAEYGKSWQAYRKERE